MGDRHAELRWERYPFAQHTKASLAEWAPGLRLFRYCRAYGGHNNDGDVVLVALRTESREALRTIAEGLGITIAHHPPDGDIEQPGHVRIGGEAVFAWVERGQHTLSISDEHDPYLVSERSVASARRVEPSLTRFARFILEPPRDDEHRICPKCYPELWSARE